MRRGLTVTVLLLGLPAIVWAHVTVWPRESRAGTTEKYVVRVPTEGKVATAEVELEVPPNVIIAMLAAPSGWTYEVKRESDRIVRVIWKMEIKPGEFAEFSFIARNPKQGTEIAWKVHQRYADGTSAEWVGPAGHTRPASVTKLTAPVVTPAR
ncbi:MAG: DUF1775 domain-containing protein [Acidobacteria bacterium]|nr:DUF1775 domain-containing protein [Acidobacteriota bacterium]